MAKLKNNLNDRQSLWNWGAINEEIAFQIRRLHLKAVSNITKPILLNKYR